MAKILVVDDSALMRRLICQGVQEEGHEVKTARNGAEAVAELVNWQPDAVTLDINMPEMDGLTALSLMMSARPTPTIMVSSLTEKGAMATLEALALGALDFITKPGGTISLSIEEISFQLKDKIRAALRARQGSSKVGVPPRAAAPRSKVDAPASKPVPKAPGAMAHGAVLIGVSTGGPRTLEEILPQLPGDFPWPIVVAQHMPPNFTGAFAQRMNGLCALEVQEVTGPVSLEPGHVYIGKGGTDVVILERMGRAVVQPKPETPGHPWHPSVSMLVDTAMKVFPPEKLVGVMLTGMGNDGAEPMARLRRQGGRTIAESAETAVVFGMPHELIELGGAMVVKPCHEIARQLKGWLN